MEKNMEQFDLVDDENRPLGIRKPRDNVHRDGDWHRTSQVWIVNRKHELLCDRRGETVDSWPGYWDALFGGHLSAGSNYLETAVKELSEEVGIVVSEARLRHLTDYRLDEVDAARGVKNREFQRVYLLRTDQVDFELSPTEVAEVRFIPSENLAEIIEGELMRFIPKPEYYLEMIGLIRTVIGEK